MFISNSADETAAVGRQYANNAQAGDVFALRGELGAGKTQFVKGLVAGLGSDAPVTSPTFTILHEYEGGRLPAYHFDFYRLETREATMRPLPSRNFAPSSTSPTWFRPKWNLRISRTS